MTERYKNTITTLVKVVAFIAALVTVIGAYPDARKLYRGTIGHRAAMLKEIEKMTAGVNIEYVQQTFGKAVFQNKSKSTNKTEHVFVDRYFYIQVITDDNGVVIAYSVTTRMPNFNPVLNLGSIRLNDPEIKIVLGKTLFSYLSQIDLGLEGLQSYGFARFSSYNEIYYLGNPGQYQSYVFSENPFGVPYATAEHPGLIVYPDREKYSELLTNQKLKHFRENTVINTYTVTAPHIKAEDLGEFLGGPEHDQLRTLRE